MARAQIFIVDDDEDMATSFAEILALSGYEVRITTNPAQMVNWIKRGEWPDVICTDYIMTEEMNGADLLKDLRLEGFTGPVILISAEDFENAPTGFNRILRKPINAKELSTAVDYFLTEENHSSATR